MEFKADALLLRAADYGENDKIVTLLTAQRGKIAAALKGVKRRGRNCGLRPSLFVLRSTCWPSAGRETR